MIRHARKWLGAGVGLDAHIDNAQLVAEAARKDTDGGASARDITQHLEGHCLGKCANAFVGDSVIGNKHSERAGSLPCGTVAANCSIASYDLLELTETAGRFGQRVQTRVS